MATYSNLRDSTDPAKQRSKRPHMVRYRDHTGKQRAEQFTRKADADARLLEVRTAEQTGRLDVLDAGTKTLAQVGKEYVSLYGGAWEESSTADGYRLIWNSCVLGQPKAGARRRYPRAAIADMPVRSIRKSHVTQFREEALAAGVPPSSVKRALSLITRSLDHAADEGMIAANPAARVQAPKPKPRPRIYTVTPAEVERIRSKLDARDAALVSILAYAGLRPAELRALKVPLGQSHLHLEAMCLKDGTLRRLKARGEGSIRSVPVCRALAADLAAVDWGSGFLVENVNGGPWTKDDWDNWRTRKFAPAVKAAGVPIKRPYDLRHAIASLWQRQGIDAVQISQWLGNSVEELQRTYLHPVNDLDPADRRTVDQMIAAARRTRKDAA